MEGRQAAARTAPRSRYAPAPPPVSRTRPRAGPASSLAATPAARGGYHAFPPRPARVPVHRPAPEGMTRGALVHLHALVAQREAPAIRRASHQRHAWRTTERPSRQRSAEQRTREPRRKPDRATARRRRRRGAVGLRRPRIADPTLRGRQGMGSERSLARVRTRRRARPAAEAEGSSGARGWVRTAAEAPRMGARSPLRRPPSWRSESCPPFERRNPATPSCRLPARHERPRPRHARRAPTRGVSRATRTHGDGQRGPASACW